MSYPKEFVTHCVMTSEAGANPLGHALLILSTQDSETAPIRVINAFGFYSQPSTTTNPLIKGLKQLLGFNINLQDGHGILKQEHMRELDGNGLTGISFEVTNTQFENVRRLCHKKMLLETIAIEEATQYLEAQGKEANADTVYHAELKRAESKQRPPRLAPFHIAMSINSHGLDSSASHACKNYALNVLLEANIIDKETLDAIAGGPSAHAFPRFGGLSLAPLRLVSTGDPEPDISRRTQKVHFNRVWNKNKLYWATSPYAYNSESPQTELASTNDQYLIIADIITRVRAVEMKLLHKIYELENPKNNTGNNKYLLERLKEQQARVQALYEYCKMSPENQRPHCLNHAEATINAASMLLSPEKINYPFILRAYESIAIRNALLGLLSLLVATVFISNPVGAIVATTSALFTGHQLYSFFKEESHYAKMHTDYNHFLRDKYQSITVNELAPEKEDHRLSRQRV